jgi:hypothetical protein
MLLRAGMRFCDCRLGTLMDITGDEGGSMAGDAGRGAPGRRHERLQRRGGDGPGALWL